MFSWGDELPTLQGDGLALRMLDGADVPALHEIFSDHEGRGLGFRAVATVLRFAFDSLGVSARECSASATT